MLRTDASAVFLIASLFASWPTFAQEIAFQYTGETGFLPGSFFGNTIAPASPVSGTFRFDPGSAATHMFSANRVGYRQQISDGLTLSVNLSGGPINIVAHEFLVIVSNDVSSPLGGTSDAVEFAFQTDFIPSLTTPLEINGNSVTTADVNRDGILDIADYGALAAAFGSSSAEADLNFDQTVNAADFVVLRDDGGGPLGLLSVVFQSFADPFDTTDLSLLDLANTLQVDPVGTFLSPFNPVSNNLGFTPVDFTFEVTTLGIAPPLVGLVGNPALTTAVPEPASAASAIAMATIAGFRCRRSKRSVNRTRSKT